MALNKKKCLAQLLSPFLGRAAGFRASFIKRIPVLAYHRVLDVNDVGRFPFDIELVSASVSEFERQMEYVKNNFTTVTFEQIISANLGKGELPSRPIVITFDDGFDDNYEHAYPILKRLNLTATIFVSTGYIGTDKPFWFDWLAYLIKEALLDGVYHVRQNIVIDARTSEARCRSLGFVLSVVKRVPNNVRLDILKEIEGLVSDTFPSGGFRLSKALTWDQVREMSDGGIEFGSHTVTHPILANVDDKSDLFYELDESKRMIELNTGKSVNVLAYPVGGEGRFDQKVCELACEVGYLLGVSYVSGVEKNISVGRFDVRRLHVERYTSMADFKALLTLPELFS